LGLLFWKIGDAFIIDGFGPDGVAKLSQKLALKLRVFQSGFIFSYAFVMIAGVLVLVSILIYSYLV